ncbi:MAG: S41 family peptidase [Planctomycetota bacterium]|nr:S41 family peptidase [Planctomycetota bacterium]
MPRRNLLLILLVAAASLLCHRQADQNRYTATLSEVISLIHYRYVEDIPPRELYENAMKGLAEGLDPYSAYIKPAEYRQLMEDLVQEFGGIGVAVELNPDTKRLTVMAPLANTPAARAGMKAGDLILKIDGRDTLHLLLKDTVNLIQGKPGSIVRLTVLHAGEKEPVELTLERAIIQLESVYGETRQADGKWSFLLPEHPPITYVRILTFGEKTVVELTKVLQDQPVEALLIDLRDDAGGLFAAAVGMCEMFVPQGEIVSTRGRGGKVLRTYTASGKTVLDPQVPMAVLVNHYSASASEVVAACLQDHGRAKIIGQRTWGKGTVQNIFSLEAGKAALKLTTAGYWRPSGKNIHRLRGVKDDADWGVKPDPGFEVVMTDEEANQVRKQRHQRDAGRGAIKPDAVNKENGNDAQDSQANGKGGKDSKPFEDPQLRQAIEYLESQLKSPSAK